VIVDIVLHSRVKVFEAHSTIAVAVEFTETHHTISVYAVITQYVSMSSSYRHILLPTGVWHLQLFMLHLTTSDTRRLGCQKYIRDINPLKPTVAIREQL